MAIKHIFISQIIFNMLIMILIALFLKAGYIIETQIIYTFYLEN